MLKRLLSLAIIFTLLSSIFIVPVSFAGDKYETPVLNPTETTYIRRGVNDKTFNESNVIVVDSDYGNLRLSFIRFSGAEYKDYIENAKNITLSLTPRNDAGDESLGSRFSIVPLNGKYK